MNLALASLCSRAVNQYWSIIDELSIDSVRIVVFTDRVPGQWFQDSDAFIDATWV